ncbi:MAG: hypothetical protein JWN26_118 [Candidatus Saccharibacteria bacterium]|nr:hypothetical protein [Candidatus Saccharibacteria bacterium]
MAQDNKVQPTVTNGLAFGVTSLITGIVAFLTGWVFFLSIPAGAVAIVFAALSMKRQGSKGLAIAGLATGIIGAAFGLGILILAIIGSLTAGAPSVPVDHQSMFYRY